MSAITYEILVIIVLVFVNGIFAMSEVALLSARKARLQHAAASGNRRAQAALDLLQDPNNFLSTVQIGVTLVGVFSGAFGGITIAEQIAEYLQRNPAVAPYGERIGLTVVVLAITYLSLVVGELVPKRIALNRPERIASGLAKPMALLSRLATPLVYVLGFSTNAVLALFRVRPSKEPAVTEEEVKVLLRQATQIGVFEPTEQLMVERVFRLADRNVSAVMTLRRDIVWLEINDPWQENQRKIQAASHSRFPVCDGDLDRVLGVLHSKDLLAFGWQANGPSLRDLLKKPLFVSEQLTALRVLERFRGSAVHLALVVDEYGGVQGLVTANDMLEAIAGELTAEGPSERPIVQREGGSWLLDGTLPIEDVRDLLKLEALPGEEKGAYRTLAGFVIDRLKKIPSVSDQFVWHGVRFEVVDMDGNRVDKVLVVPATENAPGARD
jgi:putative hemolysin